MREVGPRAASVRVLRLGIAFERGEEFLGLAPMCAPTSFVMPSGVARKRSSSGKFASADRSRSESALDRAPVHEARNERKVVRRGMLRILPRACL